jgi:hypothetical protein
MMYIMNLPYKPKQTLPRIRDVCFLLSLRIFGGKRNQVIKFVENHSRTSKKWGDTLFKPLGLRGEFAQRLPVRLCSI